MRADLDTFIQELHSNRQRGTIYYPSHKVYALLEAYEALATPAKAAGGWRLVPVEITEAMIEGWYSGGTVSEAYEAMLASAPSTDGERQPEGGE